MVGGGTAFMRKILTVLQPMTAGIPLFKQRTEEQLARGWTNAGVINFGVHLDLHPALPPSQQ